MQPSPMKPDTKIPPDADGVHYKLTSILGTWHVQAWRINSRYVGVSQTRPLPVYGSRLTDAKAEAKANLSEDSI